MAAVETETYVRNLPDERRERFRSILGAIKSLYPTAVESMKYKMPTYEYGGAWVAAANQKRYLSFYTCSAAHIASFKRKHPGITTGKGCINFRDGDEIPIDDLKQVIKSAMESSHA